MQKKKIYGIIKYDNILPKGGNTHETELDYGPSIFFYRHNMPSFNFSIIFHNNGIAIITDLFIEDYSVLQYTNHHSTFMEWFAAPDWSSNKEKTQKKMVTPSFFEFNYNLHY